MASADTRTRPLAMCYPDVSRAGRQGPARPPDSERFRSAPRTSLGIYGRLMCRAQLCPLPVMPSRRDLAVQFKTILRMAKSLPQPESWLAALPTELSQSLFANARPLSVAASRTLFVAGDEGDGCYRVEEGLLKASVSVAAGGERILAILGPGSVVGELSMIDNAPRSASITALRDSKLSFVDRATFETFGQSTPQLYRHITTLLARRLRDTNEALVATNFLSVKGRVARAVLSLAEAFGRDLGQGRILIRQKVSQSDLAAMAGIARENVSRVLNDWAGRSLVRRLAGYYCLDDRSALQRETEE